MNIQKLIQKILFLSLVSWVFFQAQASTVKETEGLLIEAIRSGDYDSVASILDGGIEPNYFLPDGSSPLAWAVETQDKKIVQMLLAAGADPDAFISASTAPLILACQYGDPEILDLLLADGANVNVELSDGITALSVCAGNASVSVVEQLITSGAEVEQADQKGQTPLMWAAAKGNVENIQLLLEYGAEVNSLTEKGFTPLFFALKSGVSQAPVIVLEAGGNPDHVAPDGTTVVQLAMYQDAYDFAAMMVERGADLNAFDRNGNQLLHAAVLANQPSLVSLLLNKGSEVNELTGESKVIWRYERNFSSKDYYVPPKPPLILAAEQGFSEVMKLLLDSGADTGFETEEGMNIVLSATNSGKLEALKVALEILPVPNTANNDGQTPLHLLLGNDPVPDTEAMMDFLKEKGAEIDIENGAGQTAFDIFKDAQQDAKDAFEKIFNEEVGALEL